MDGKIATGAEGKLCLPFMEGRRLLPEFRVYHVKSGVPSHPYPQKMLKLNKKLMSKYKYETFLNLLFELVLI